MLIVNYDVILWICVYLLPGIRGVISLKNKLNYQAEFTWSPILGDRGTAFSVRPATGKYIHHPPKVRPATGKYIHHPPKVRLDTGKYMHHPPKVRPSTGKYIHHPPRVRPATGKYMHHPPRVRPATGKYIHHPPKVRPATGKYIYTTHQVGQATGKYIHHPPPSRSDIYSPPTKSLEYYFVRPFNHTIHMPSQHNCQHFSSLTGYMGYFTKYKILSKPRGHMKITYSHCSLKSTLYCADY